MREIKFRAWNNKAKIMYPAEHFALCCDGTWMQLMDRETNRWLPCQADMTFMQYTGLHDKNGKEIFEGDILKQAGRLFEVHWHVGDARLGLNMLYAEDEGPHVHSSRVPLRDWNWIGSKNRVGAVINFHGEKQNFRKEEGVEIIGNIYENPELLHD